MPTITDMEYGYSTEGVEAYIEAIRSEALLQAEEAVKDVTEITTCCQEQWEGRARDNFVQNLQNDANHVAGQFEALYNVLVSEIRSLNAAMANKDESLIQAD
jgi:uncharacterized protein YukE